MKADIWIRGGESIKGAQLACVKVPGEGLLALDQQARVLLSFGDNKVRFWIEPKYG